MTWDTLDGIAGVLVILCGYGAIRMARIIEDRYQTQRMSREWLDRHRRRGAL